MQECLHSLYGKPKPRHQFSLIYPPALLTSKYTIAVHIKIASNLLHWCGLPFLYVHSWNVRLLQADLNITNRTSFF